MTADSFVALLRNKLPSVTTILMIYLQFLVLSTFSFKTHDFKLFFFVLRAVLVMQSSEMPVLNKLKLFNVPHDSQKKSWDY